MRSDSATLVPPRRLGGLLRQTRVAAGLELQDLAGGVGLTVVDLDDIEHGRRLIDDDLLGRLAALYGIERAGLLPERSQLVIDLDEGRVAIDDQDAVAPGEPHGADAILARYLALVYHLRELPLGTKIGLRDADVDVLATALGLEPHDIESRLFALMADEDTVALDQQRIKRRVLMPLVGVVIAAVSSGVLLLVADTEDGDSTGPVATETTPAGEASMTDVGAAIVATDIGVGGAVELNPAVGTELGNPAVETNPSS
ncbi:MAG: helix-turn-helix transcriptional regulator [Actinomycetota bacterium]